MPIKADTRWSEQALETLSRAGFRQGAARQSVVEVLAQEQCCLSASEIKSRLDADGQKIGSASIYRALEALHGLDLVRRVDTGDGQVRYEAEHTSGEHHHHTVCRRCGRVETFDDARLERAIERVVSESDYEIETHDITLRGLCPDCARASRGARRAR